MKAEKLTYNKEAIRDRLPFPALIEREMGEISRRGTAWVVCCPFHAEKTPSFHVYEDHGYCFGGCGRYDIFEFWMARRGCDFEGALADLSGMVGLSGTVETDRPLPKPKSPVKREEEWIKPVVPPMRALTTAEIRQLAALRGLDPLAVRIAAREYKRVGFCAWPQYPIPARPGQWNDRFSHPSYVVTDAERWSLNFRRLDGLEYTKGGEPAGKSRRQGKGAWPVGVLEMGDRANVLLCEGETDTLAAYHFLYGFGGAALLDRVAVVGIMGSSNGIAPHVLHHFRGKRVRIMIDADPAKPLKKALDTGRGAPLARPFCDETGLPFCPPDWRVASLVAAERWQKQLTEAGAVVQTFSLYGLWRADGKRVGDLNDLAWASAETLGSEEIYAAFFDWDF